MFKHGCPVEHQQKFGRLELPERNYYMFCECMDENLSVNMVDDFNLKIVRIHCLLPVGSNPMYQIWTHVSGGKYLLDDGLDLGHQSQRVV